MKKVLTFILLIAATTATMHAQKKWTLKECVDYALDNSISIKQAQLNRESTEIDKSDAVGNFLPSINASSSHSWNIGLNQNITTGILENQTTQNTSVGLNMNVTLFDGLQNVNRLHRANLAILANQYQLDDIKDNTSLQVVQAFLQILFNKESLKVLEAQYAVTKAELERTNELVKEGVLPRGDKFEIEANLATQEQQIVNAENALRFSKISLAQLLLITDYENFDIAEGNYMIPSTTIMNNTPRQIFEKSMEVRNNIKISEANIQLAEYDLKIAKGQRYPTLSGFYSFNTRATNSDIFAGFIPDTEDPFNTIGFVEGTGENVLTPNFLRVTEKSDPLFDQFSDNKGHSFGLQLSIPIFNGFRTSNNVKRSEIAIERAKYNLEQSKIDLEATVNQAYNDAKGALKAYEAAEKTLLARREAHRNSTDRFSEGMMNSFDFSQSKQRLESAESDVVRTKYDYIFRLKILEFYFGLPLTDLQ
ncbi:TolC family protein [Kordia algicida OT-1]|uniref:Putative outer membrane transport/efflux protein n=1 Tax=Kordia algicida OT-1 TaxID=391587 RepID=A9DPJ3_9FLAO|nr:TolC family protein [Kordia algicida]EDP97448.1 putative outer membrane transport/efflux protein [Kordia algicida OT-1]